MRTETKIDTVIFLFTCVVLIVAAIRMYPIEEVERTEEVQVDQEAVCFNTTGTEYESVCYSLDQVNVTMEEDGSIQAKPVGTVIREEAAG